MIARGWVVTFLVALLVSSIPGCGREKAKNDYELGKEYFEASDYGQAIIRLDRWVQKSDRPNLTEAHAILAVIYHDYPNRQEFFEIELNKLREIGEPGMAAVLELMKNTTVASRLGDTINDILVKCGKLSVGPLIRDLTSHNWRLAINAQETLAKIGEPAVEPLIATLKNDTDIYTRSVAIEALKKIGDKRAVAPLEQRLNDPSRLIQVTAAAALHAMDQRNPEKVIIKALEDPDFEVRRAAAEALYETMENPPIDSVVKLLKDPDPEVRNFAALTAGKLHSTEAVPMLTKLIKEDKDDRVRASAGKSLESIGKPAVDPLINILANTKDQELIIRIAQILGNVNDKRAIEPLEKIYKTDDRPLVKNEVAKALNKID